LKAAGCIKRFLEKKYGASTQNRHELAAALDYLQEADVFVVTRLDRLPRSPKDSLGSVPT
jgi:DNA invertase Pin-like site-specific DNA recombinase